MPRWFIRDCDICGGSHRSRADAEAAHREKGATPRPRRKTKHAGGARRRGQR